MNQNPLRTATAMLVLAAVMLSCGSAVAQESGEAIFGRICKACHTIGQGKLVGPDLAGATQRHSQDWLLRFIKSSQSMVKSGDPVAVALFEENNKLIMPDNPISDAEVRNVLGYIESVGGGAGAAPALPTPLETATAADLALGQDLFSGKVRLAAGGPACRSCHHVTGMGIMGGGTLARDLTQVVGRMGALGAQAVLTAPPFPVMTRAYADHPLSEQEIFSLVAFLEQLDRDQVLEASNGFGLGLFFAGLVGAILLVVLYALIWMNRKQGSVYGAIHARQLKS